jgi:hypothetical protein
VGNFRGLGEVAIAKGVACNILFACQMLDTGRTFKYDDKNEDFVITGLNESYAFACRRRPDGSKTRFYTLKFAFVATIAENLRRYSAREFKQAREAFWARDEQAVINIIKSGMMNCPVSDTDVRDKEAAKGVSIAGLLRKTTKKASMSPGCVIAPRVT